VTHRYEVIAKYAKSVRTICADELRALRASAVSVDLSKLKHWLHIDTNALPPTELEQRERVMKASTKLATVYAMRDELAALWQRSAASKEQLVHQLEDWCKRAEASGIESLQNFSRRLRCYA
jgi:stearoyl-CoA desaturase (delta-9 desaturase)